MLSAGSSTNTTGSCTFKIYHLVYCGYIKQRRHFLFSASQKLQLHNDVNEKKKNISSMFIYI